MDDIKYQLSNSNPIKPSVPVGIVGVGSYLPSDIVSNKDFVNIKMSEEDVDFMNSKSGIKERRWAKSETFTDMAIKAAKNALENANISPLEIDMVVVTHITQDPLQLTPPNSVTIQTAIGATNATAINIDQGFTGWMYAMITGASYVASGFYNKVLVVSGESIMPHTDSTIMKALLVGDGAGAFIMQKTEADYGLLAFHMMSEQYPEIAAEVGLQFAKAAPCDSEISQKAFFKIAPNSFSRDLPKVKNFLPFSVHKTLSCLNLKPEDVNHYVLAQKFEWLNKQWANIIGVDYNKVHDTLNKHACMETSSIPVITHDAMMCNKLKKGDLVMFADLGSNWSVASALFRWCI